VYAYARAQRADGTESIVVSAPLYTSLNDKKHLNLIGLSEMFIVAELVKSRKKKKKY
jgi:hypothetical protein